MNPLLDHALAVAARGWPVFPLRPGTKRPALHGTTSCPHTGPCMTGHLGWEQRATTDPDRIRRAWNTAPFNIGLPTGPAGLVVVDLDTPKSPADVPPDGWNREGVSDGHDVFALVCEQARQPVPWETFTVRTARGGSHLYFVAPSGVELRNTEGDAGGLGWKVDTRAHGGYVVAPGSNTPHGAYTVLDDREPVELPGWLIQALSPKPRTALSAPVVVPSQRMPAYVAAAVQGERDRVAAAQPGAHTRTLFIAAVALGQLVAAGHLPPATAEAHLHAAATHMITDQCHCTEREVLRTITNGLRAGASRPRQAPADRQQLGVRGAA
ncbi:bifunctional DNA primase/polymerase [Umezawaea beigongshangensis]|uniref:bifunctional DNA primase/polymerase n=1 Tax=Umezawaea beigongshangensis TaxID=2780383 RepID=UPI0018F152FC|nr:bifunctional DNA primase/polymerase [Umezawaea beigongshangensis]